MVPMACRRTEVELVDGRLLRRPVGPASGRVGEVVRRVVHRRWRERPRLARGDGAVVVFTVVAAQRREVAQRLPRGVTEGAGDGADALARSRGHRAHGRAGDQQRPTDAGEEQDDDRSGRRHQRLQWLTHECP